MNRGYTNIPDWMLELDLDIYETIILAVIYGFSQDGESAFKGAQAYLAKKAKCTTRKIRYALARLIELGYVEKKDKDVSGVHLCEYRIGIIFRTTAQYSAPAEQHSYNNIDNNISTNVDINSGSVYKEPVKKFVKPTLEEITAYCSARGNTVDPLEFFSYYESNGWKVGRNPMRSWQSAMVTWEKKREADKKRTPRASKPFRKETSFERSIRVGDELFGTNMHKQMYGNQTDKDYDEQ